MVQTLIFQNTSFKKGCFYVILFIWQTRKLKNIDGIIPEPEAGNSEVLEFEFNEDGEEDLKKTLKKLRADLKAGES